MRKNLVGAKFGNLFVLEPAPDYITPRGIHITRWVCVCDCGNTAVVRSTNLLHGHTRSCGCARKQKPSEEKIEACVFHPTSIDCTKLNCEKCGWNPNNEGLRKSRIIKLTRKDGTDE